MFEYDSCLKHSFKLILEDAKYTNMSAEMATTSTLLKMYGLLLKSTFVPSNFYEV